MKKFFKTLTVFILVFVAVFAVAGLTACGAKEVKTSYKLTGRYVNTETNTVVNYQLELYSDNTLVMNSHEKMVGTWEKNSDNSLTMVIGGVTYTAQQKDFSYTFEYNAKIGEVDIKVMLTNAVSQTEEQLNKVFEGEVKQLKLKYEGKTGEVIFYGASNFARWSTLEEQISGYPVQNKAFGGAPDTCLRNFAPDLLYGSAPKIVVLMNSSNTFSSGKSASEIISYKLEFFNEMKAALPDTVFLLQSATPNPLRYFGEYHDKMVEVDAKIKEYCENNDKFEYFNLISDLTASDGTVNPDIWIEDNLHLNAAGYQILADLTNAKLAEVCQKYTIGF